MKLLTLLTASALISVPALAQEARHMDAHEHGVGQLDIALQGQQVAMALLAPGADIVGFEYAAQSDQDHAAIDAAIAVLSQPLELFAFPAAANCTVVEAHAELEGEDEHEDHDAEHGHDDHDDASGHTEFHAEYLLNCENPAAITDITFTYFTAFPNALELETQIISDAGATAAEVERDAPVLNLSDLF